MRAVIPNHILSHCPQTPYFKNEYYVHGGYKTVNDNVGDAVTGYGRLSVDVETPA